MYRTKKLIVQVMRVQHAENLIQILDTNSSPEQVSVSFMFSFNQARVDHASSDPALAKYAAIYLS